MIYAFDFDNTLAITEWPRIISPIHETIDFAKKVKDDGHIIILWTCREGKTLDEALEFCKKYNLEFDCINDNYLPRQIEYGDNPRKIYADYYIDDHNFNMKELLYD